MSFKCSQDQLSIRQACLAFNVLTILKLIECSLKIISLWKRHVEIFQRYYSSRSINCIDVLWWSYLIKIDEISKSTFHNERRVWIFWNVVTIIFGEAKKAKFGISQRRQLTATCGCLRRTGRIPNCSWTRRRAFRRDNQNITLIHWTHVLSSRI